MQNCFFIPFILLSRHLDELLSVEKVLTLELADTSDTDPFQRILSLLSADSVGAFSVVDALMLALYVYSAMDDARYLVKNDFTFKM